MDMTSRFYRDEYLEARDHARNGRPVECLDILWDLRLRPDLSLYRRALVNLLIATQADIGKHPDIKKFADEALLLVAQIRRQGRYDTSDPSEEAALKKIEDHAQKTLADIDNDFARILEEEKGRAQPSLTSQTETLAIKDSPQRIVFNREEGTFSEEPENLTSSSETMKDKMEIDSATDRREWRIEGMFTDVKRGLEVEQATQQAVVEKEGEQMATEEQAGGPSLLPVGVRKDEERSHIMSPPPSSPPRGPK